MALTAAEAKVIEAALAQGWLTAAQVQAARAERTGSGAALLTLLRTRHLSPSQAQQLGKVYEEALRESARHAASAERRIGPYRIAGELGRGGMGIVHRAVGPDGEERAVKVLLGIDATRRARFAREVSVLQFVGRHANIVTLHDSGEDGATPWLAMDLLPGGSLANRLEETPHDLCALVGHLEVVANALHFAHEAGVLHRDIKPSNILYDAQGAPCLADFGMAADAEAVERLTRTGDMTGTIGHMAPEQLRPEGRSVDRRVDVYALGTVLYEVLAGRPAFEGPPLAVLSRVLSAEEPEPPSAVAEGVPPALEAACLRAMAKDPDARTPIAAAFQAELRAWLGARPDTRSSAERPAAPAGRSGTPVALALAALMVGLAGLIAGWSATARARALAATAADRSDALALELRTLGPDPRRTPAVADAPALERVVVLDPGRTASWAALGALAFDRGDMDRAAACLARSAAPADDLRAARLAGALAEREGRGEAARDAALVAVLAGDDDPRTLSRLIRCAARVAEAQGLATTTEGLLWHALRADPSDPSPLEAILAARLDGADLEALTALWVDLRRALAGPTLADLVREARAGGAATPIDALNTTFGRLDPPPSIEDVQRLVLAEDFALDRPLRTRLLAALDAAEAGPPSTPVIQALEALVAGEPPLLAEAARASLVALGLRDGKDIPPRLLATPWPALTLLEGAARRAPLADDAVLLNAPAPLVRSAAAVTKVAALTKPVTVELDPLLSDPDLRTAACVRRLLAAQMLILDEQATGEVRPPLDALLLAWSFMRLPSRPLLQLREVTRKGLASRTEPEACLARALDAAAVGDLDGASAAVVGASADDARAAGLRAVLAVLRGEPAPPPVRDPLAAARAATLAALAERTGCVFTWASGGAVRVDVAFGAGRPFPERLLERWSQEETTTDTELQTPGPLRIRLRLPLARADSLHVEGGSSATQGAWRLALGDGGTELVTSRGQARLRTDMRTGLFMEGGAPMPLSSTPRSLVVSSRRGCTMGIVNMQLTYDLRMRAQRGAVTVGTGFSGERHALRALTIVGVWTGRFEAPPALTRSAPPLLSPDLTVTLKGDGVRTVRFEEVLHRGVTLTPMAVAGEPDRIAQAAFCPILGDLDVCVRVSSTPGKGAGARSAGIGLREAASSACVSVMVQRSDASAGPRVFAGLQSAASVQWPCGGPRFPGDAPVFLRLRRRGDTFSFAAGPALDGLVDVGAPVVFALGQPVTLIFVTSQAGSGEAGTTRFDEVEVRAVPLTGPAER